MVSIAMTNLQIALESDPQKKGVVLYRVTDGQCEYYVWARSNQEALAAAAKHKRFEAFPFRVGVVMETPLDLDPGAWEGLNV